MSRGNGVFIVETETAVLLLGAVRRLEADIKGRMDLETVGEGEVEPNAVVATVGEGEVEPNAVVATVGEGEVEPNAVVATVGDAGINTVVETVG